MKIHLIAGARPNFMKIAPLYHALKKEDWADVRIVHTGQHYDKNMSENFFKDLSLPKPDCHFFGIGDGDSHAKQTAKIMMVCEQLFIAERPDLIIVVGDVNSTLAATLAASKLGIKIAHLEAGLRAFDRSLPEEINRIVTDILSNILWTPSMDADTNLLQEGISIDKIHRVGNIMIDSLEMMREKIENQNSHTKFGVKPNEYGLITLHRPANVDDDKDFWPLCRKLNQISKQNKIPLIFSIHPRTMKKWKAPRYHSHDLRNLQITPALGYIDFMSLMYNSRFVITDSGGIQEETSYLGIPCATLRPNTERPITISCGTNRLCKTEDLFDCADAMMQEKHVLANIDLWDGNTAGRIARSIKDEFKIQ